MTPNPKDPKKPFDPFENAMFLSDELGDLFDGHKPFGRSETGFLAGKSFKPSADIHETPAGLVISIDIPGVEREEIDIQLEGARMTVSGKRDFVRDCADEETVRLERGFGSFRRVFEIPYDIEPESISAKLERGVLSILVPINKRHREIKVESEV